MADDTPDLESFYVGRLTDRQGDDYRPVTDEDRETKWSDYSRALGSGALNLGSGVAGVAEYATQGKVGSDARRWLDKQAEETVDNMTPVAKRALNSSFIADEGEDSILDTGVGRSLALKVTAASPSLVASVIPAGVVGAALRGASLATRVGAAGATARGTAGVLSAGDVVNNIYGTIDKMSDEQLAQQSSVFAGYLSMGMDPTDAREKYMRDVAGSAPIVAGAVSAMLAGTEVDIAKILAGGAKKGFVLGAKEGVINEGRQEMAETFTGEFLSAQALADAGLSEISWQKILSKTIEGGVVGGLIGGAAGGASNLGGATPSAPPKGNTTGEAPPPPAVPDLGNTTNPPGGSETQYPKVKAAISVSKKRGGVAVVDGPVGATEAAALSPQVSPEITQKVAGLEATSEVTPPPAPASPPVPPEIAEKAAGVTESEAPATTPETPDQITAQFADLVSSENPRSVVFIPNGNKTAIPDEVSSNSNFDTVKLGKAYPADTRGQYVYDKTKTDPVAIRKAAKTGTLGELLGMGPTNKEQAVADIAAGAQPLAIQVRDENGTPKVEQGTSSATVDQDIPVVQGNANPTDTIEVTTPQAVQAERQSDLVPAPVSPKVGPKTGRILESLGNKETQAKTNEVIATNLKAVKKADKKAEKLANTIAEGPANDEMVGQYTGKDNKRASARADRDAVAKEVFDAHPPSEVEADWNHKDKTKRAAAREAMVARINQAVRKAMALSAERGVKLPSKQSPQMSNENVWLLDAVRLLQGVGTKGMGRSGSFQEFAMKERSYRGEDQGKGARADRREGGDLAKRKDQGSVEDKAAGVGTSAGDNEFYQSPEQALIAKQEADAGPETEEFTGKRTAAPKKVIDEARVKAALRRADVMKRWAARAEKRAAAKAKPVEKVKKPEAPKAFDEVAAEKERLKSLFKDLPDEELQKRAQTNIDEANKAAAEYRAKKAKPEKRQMTAEEWLAANDPESRVLEATDQNKNEYGDPLPEESEKVQKAIEGKTVVQVAKWLEDNAPRSSHRMVARRVRVVLEKMQAAGVKFNFNVLHLGDKTPPNSGGGWRGVNILKYDQGRLQNDVYIVGADVKGLVGTSYEVVLHELIHAATKSVTFMGNRKLSSDLKIAKLSQELFDVTNAILTHFNKRAKIGDLTEFEKAIYNRMNNALANPDEVLTWALSNQEMQDYLDGIEYKNTGQSLLKRIFSAIGEFFGIPATRGSALEEVLRVGEKIFDVDENMPEVLEAHKRFSALNKVEPSLESFFNPAIDANMSSYIPELKDRQASVQGWSGRAWTKFRAFNQLEQDFRSTVFGPALTKINEARQAAGPRARNLKDRGDALASRLIDFERKNKAEAAEITSLAQEARMLGVSLEGKNDLGTDDSAHWQAKKLLPGLQARFNNNLSSEAKQIYRDMVKFYSDSHNMIVKASVKGILQQLLLKNKLSESDIAGLTDRVINKKMNDADKALLGKTMFDNLKNAAEFHKVEGDYFPLMRFGDHVVRTEDTVKDTMGGTLEGNAVLFRNKSETAARKAAQAFAEKTDLVQLGRAEKTYFDRTNGKEVTADEAKSLNDVDIGFRVRVQTQGVYFFESEKEAHAFVRTNPEGHDVVRAPEQRMGSGYRAHILSGTQLGVMEKTVEGRTDLSDGQKALIKSIIAQSSARMVSGNRIASRRLKSQKVTGASTDTARVLLQYNTAMSRHVSTAEAAPEIRVGLDSLSKLLETYEGNDRPAIVSMVEEVKTRIDQGIHEPNEASQLMKDVLTTSSIARLFSPMYTALQMVQPWMSTLPMLGGRFGNMRAAGALSQAYADLGLGDAAVSGFLNTARATKQFSRAGLLNTDNIVDNMRARFASNKNETAMLDRLIELGAIDVHAGLEVSSAVADGRGRIGKVIAGTDRIARQLPQMAEAVNRVSTAIASYRLARESGMNHEKATQFALDTVNNTQGDYSASNAPRFFNNPVLRPAMQFRKYAQMMTYLLVDLSKRTMDSDLSPEERKIAGKQLLNFVGVQIAMAGALSLPGLELIKAGFLIASVFGLGGWDDQEEKLRKLADSTFGRPLGQMITNGVFTRLGGYGIDVSQRMSLSDMWLFGEPRKNDSESQQAYLFRLMAGSSGSFVLGVADGVKDIGNGEIEKGLGKVLPVKFAADTAKAVGAYNKDRNGEVGLGTVAVNAFGVKTAAQAEKSRDIADAMRRKDARESKRKELSKAFYDARTRGERAKAIAKNREWNAQLSKSEWRLRLPTNAGNL